MVLREKVSGMMFWNSGVGAFFVHYFGEECWRNGEIPGWFSGFWNLFQHCWVEAPSEVDM